MLCTKSIFPETRPTNEAHPARKFGLEKCKREEITQEASRKRAEKEDTLNRKQAEILMEKAAMKAKFAELAAFENDLKADREGLQCTDFSDDDVLMAQEDGTIDPAANQNPAGSMGEADIREDTPVVPSPKGSLKASLMMYLWR